MGVYRSDNPIRSGEVSIKPLFDMLRAYGYDPEKVSNVSAHNGLLRVTVISEDPSVGHFFTQRLRAEDD